MKFEDPFNEEFPTVKQLEDDARLLYKNVLGVDPEYDVVIDIYNEKLTDVEIRALFNIN